VYILPFFRESEKTLDKKKIKDEKTTKKKKQSNTPRINLAWILEKQCKVLK
jgi:hypothetical protein